MQLLVPSTQLNYRSSCVQGFSTLRGITGEYLTSSGISNARKCIITACRKHTGGYQEPTSFEDKDRGNFSSMAGSETIEVPEMVDAMGKSSGNLHHQEGLLQSDYEMDLFSEGLSKLTCSSDASRGQELTEALSGEEIRDRWDFLRHLPHKYVSFFTSLYFRIDVYYSNTFPSAPISLRI